MIITNCDQRSAEWYAVRLGKFTASSFADLMSGTATAGFENLIKDKAWERLTGTPVDGFTTPAMQHGIDNEPLARDWYSFETGELVAEVGFVSHDSLPVGCSPDGLVGKSKLLEIKSPQPRAHLETLVARKLPAKYRWQVQGQMWLCERELCDFVSHHPATGGVIVPVFGNEADFVALEKRVREADELVQELVYKAQRREAA